MPLTLQTLANPVFRSSLKVHIILVFMTSLQTDKKKSFMPLLLEIAQSQPIRLESARLRNLLPLSCACGCGLVNAICNGINTSQYLCFITCFALMLPLMSTLPLVFSFMSLSMLWHFRSTQFPLTFSKMHCNFSKVLSRRKKKSIIKHSSRIF